MYTCVCETCLEAVFLEKGDSSMRYWATEELYSLSACRPQHTHTHTHTNVHTKKAMNDCSSPPRRKSFLKHTAYFYSLLV